MRSFTVVSALASAPLVLAKPAPAPAAAPLVTAVPLVHLPQRVGVRVVENPGCDEQVIASLLDGFPRIPMNDPLHTWIGSRFDEALTSTGKPFGARCSIAYPATVDAPAPISSAYASYTREYASWASKFKPTIVSLIDACGQGEWEYLEAMLITDAGSCSSVYSAYANYVLTTTTDNRFADYPSWSTPAETSELTSFPAATSGSGDISSASSASTATTTASATATTTAITTKAESATVSTSQSVAGAPSETGYFVAGAAAVMAVAGAMIAL